MYFTQPLKTFILLAIIAVLGFWSTFAGNANETLMTHAQLLQFFFSILSWIWIIPAYFAGQFLTNSWVYGAVLGMDSYLWTCRNLMKNIANFALAFLFVFSIFSRTIFSNEEPTWVVKDLMLKLLVAGIAIQSSWFLISATIDVSTIGMSAVGALPSHLISSNSKMSGPLLNPSKTIQAIHAQICTWINMSQRSDAWSYLPSIFTKLKIDLFPKNDLTALSTQSLQLFDVEAFNTQEACDSNNSQNTAKAIDIFMPNANSLAGPLIFLGISIFDSFSVPVPDLTKHPTALIGNILINGAGIGLYAITMILLCIFAFLRIVYLWIFIALSPILILLFCFKSVGGKAKLPFLDSLTKSLEDLGIGISSILSLIFKPVFITLAVSAVLIFTLLMQTVIQKSASTSIAVVPWTRLESIPAEDTNADWQPLYHTSFVNSTLSVTFQYMTKTFAELILMVLTLIFMRFILKLAITSGNKKIDTFITDRFKAVEDVLGNIPIIPLGNGKLWGFNLAKKVKNKVTEIPRKYTNTLESKGTNDLNALFGDKVALTSTDLDDLKKAKDKVWDDPQAFIKVSKGFLDQVPVFTNSKWEALFIEWKNNLKNAKPTGDLKTLSGSTAGTLEAIRKDEKTRQAFWRLFGKGEVIPPTIPKDPLNVSS